MPDSEAAPQETAAGAERQAVPGTNSEGVNAHNRRAILHAIRVSGMMSRADLARATRLTKQTVSNIVEELEREGMVVARDTVREGRGKPATPYALAAEGAYAVGLHLDRHMAWAVVVDLRGRVLLHRSAVLRAGDPEGGIAVLADLIAATRAEAIAAHPGLGARLVGLGLAMPGPFGTARGPDETQATLAQDDEDFSMARWQHFPLVARLEQATGLEVTLQNDAAAAAAAELLSGRLHGMRNAVCIYLGYGLGAGIVVNGELYTGRDGNAGEVGMIPAPPGAPRMPVEHYASLSALCRALDLDPAAPDLAMRIIAAMADPRFDAWADRAAAELAWVARVMDLLFSPQAILLCGTAPAALVASLLSRLPGQSTGEGRGEGLVQPGLSDPWAVATGAASGLIGRSFAPRYSALLKK